MDEGGAGSLTDSGMENDSPTTFATESGTIADDDAAATTISDDDDDDPFSDKNRWRRGILEDPDSDSW